MSDLYVAEHPATYAALGITHVLSVMPGSVQLPKSASAQVLQIPIRDQPFEELAAHLAKTTAFINDALKRRGSVLVHCVQGMSRSASVVSAYLIAAYGWSVKDAVEYVRSKSSNAFPNTGFIHQLQEYRDTLRR
jgi:atypical dual specificity phosphatase